MRLAGFGNMHRADFHRYATWGVAVELQDTEWVSLPDLAGGADFSKTPE
jgi:hypothetical protein